MRDLNRNLYGRRYGDKGGGAPWVRGLEWQQRDVIHFHGLIGGGVSVLVAACYNGETIIVVNDFLKSLDSIKNCLIILTAIKKNLLHLRSRQCAESRESRITRRKKYGVQPERKRIGQNASLGDPSSLPTCGQFHVLPLEYYTISFLEESVPKEALALIQSCNRIMPSRTVFYHERGCLRFAMFQKENVMADA